MTIYNDVTLDFQSEETFNSALELLKDLDTSYLPIAYDHQSLIVNQDDLSLEMQFHSINDDYFNFYEIKDFLEGYEGQLMLTGLDLLQGNYYNVNHTIKVEELPMPEEYQNSEILRERAIPPTGRAFNVLIDNGAIKAHVEITSDSYYDNYSDNSITE